MNDFDAGYLETAVAGKDSRAQSRTNLRPERAGRSETHGGIKTLCQVQAIVADFDIQAAEERIPRFGHHHYFFVTGEKMIDLAQNIDDANPPLEGGRRFAQVVAVNDFLTVRFKARLQKSADKFFECDVLV